MTFKKKKNTSCNASHEFSIRAVLDKRIVMRSILSLLSLSPTPKRRFYFTFQCLFVNCLTVCLSVCLSVERITLRLRTDFGIIFDGWERPEDQTMGFLWRLKARTGILTGYIL